MRRREDLPIEERVLDLEARVITLERACQHQLETRALLDRVANNVGEPVTTTSDHWHDEVEPYDGEDGS
jgi:hypothetical protein